MAKRPEKGNHLSAEEFDAQTPDERIAAGDPELEPQPHEDEEEYPELPWLQAIEDEESRKGQSAIWRVGGVALAILFAAVIIYWIAGRERPREMAGEPPLSEQAPVQTEQPLEPVVPPIEQPKTRPHRSAATHTPVSTVRAVRPVHHEARMPKVTTAAASGPTIQLASYYSADRAERHWDMLTERQRGIGKLHHSIAKGVVKGRTVYRLRASGPNAFAICERLRARHVACLKIGH